MPFRRRYRRKRAFGRPFKRRRLNIRRKSRKTRITKIKLRGPALMPDSLMVKLKWYTRSVFTLNSETNAEVQIQYRSNDIYLPTATATTRAMGFQEYISLYDRWIVHASKIRVKIINNPNFGGSQLEFILYPSNDTTTESIEVARQYPYSKTCIVGIPAGGHDIKNLSNFMSFKKAEGRANYDLNYAGTETASPTAVRYWNLIGQVVPGSTDTGTADVQVDVTITYFVRFFSREDPVNTDIPALEQEANIEAYNALKNGSQPVSN